MSSETSNLLYQSTNMEITSMETGEEVHQQQLHRMLARSSGNTRAITDQVINDKLRHKVFLLNQKNDSGPEKKDRTVKRKTRRYRERSLNECHRFPWSAASDLHRLWKSYIQDILTDLFTPGVKSLSLKQKHLCGSRLLKADFHGAMIQVIRSNCPSMIGQQGIILQEFENVFRIVTSGGLVKMLPKSKCVFVVNLEMKSGLKFELEMHGQHFCTRPSERIVKKWKEKPSLDF